MSCECIDLALYMNAALLLRFMFVCLFVFSHFSVILAFHSWGTGKFPESKFGFGL